MHLKLILMNKNHRKNNILNRYNAQLQTTIFVINIEKSEKIKKMLHYQVEYL